MVGVKTDITCHQYVKAVFNFAAALPVFYIQGQRVSIACLAL